MRALRLAGLAVICFGTVVAPCVAAGQTTGQVRRVGVIYLSGTHREVVDGMQEGLRELGVEVGKTIVMELRPINPPFDHCPVRLAVQVRRLGSTVADG
jgi:hypothetical protein